MTPDQTPGQKTDNATSGQRPSSSVMPTYKGIRLTIANVDNKFPEIRKESFWPNNGSHSMHNLSGV